MARGTPDWGAVTGGVQAVVEHPTYIVGTEDQLPPGAVQTLLSLFNPDASGRLIKVRRVFVSSGASAFNVSAETRVALYHTTSLGTGAVVTPQALDPNDAISVATARSQLSVEPTGKTLLLLHRLAVDRSSVVNQARAFWSDELAEIFNQFPGQAARPITLLQGRGLAFTTIDAIAAGFGIAAHFMYTEEPS